MLRRRHDPATGDSLEQWLADGYAAAYRVAWLILHDRADAEEAVQEAFLRAWRFRDAIPDGTGVQPWLYRVTVNACISKLRADRSRGRQLQTALDSTELPASEVDRLEPDVRDAVGAALGALPEHLRVVVVLRYYAQLSEKEIADVIKRRPGTVKSRLHEARSRLGSDPTLAAAVREEVVS